MGLGFSYSFTIFLFLAIVVAIATKDWHNALSVLGVYAIVTVIWKICTQE